MGESKRSQWDDRSFFGSDRSYDNFSVNDPEVDRIWHESRIKRRFSLLFARIRKSLCLSQAQVSERAEWNKSFVSRLEGSQGSVPDLQTIVRFAKACGADVGLIVSRRDSEGRYRIIDALVVPDERIYDADIPLFLDSLKGMIIPQDDPQV